MRETFEYFFRIGLEGPVRYGLSRGRTVKQIYRDEGCVLVGPVVNGYGGGGEIGENDLPQAGAVYATMIPNGRGRRYVFLGENR